ncbi:prepilin peptidase [Sporichthya polymorpha]|uniref:prepilin peptidase n=1 Tax=Sporichthya polymorpha TaxID=35751 RepID=UPI000377D942|nr:A24 family peptidase [Sporichthya polymorpha]
MSPELMAAGALALLGLVIGSFLNVVVHRVPAGQSVVRPGSSCPECGSPVRARDNIPVVSWLLLRGRCRDCAHPISARYPLVELGCAALFGALTLRFGLSPILPALLFLAAIGLALAMIDLDVSRLPFEISVPGLGVTAVLLALAGLADGWSPVAVALLSALAWFGLYWSLWFGTGGRGMGLGDVVLAPTLGLALGWLGWGPSLVGLLGGFAIGSVVGVTLMAIGRAGRRSQIPFGPSMLAGALVGVFAGSAIWGAYLGSIG